MHALLPPQSLWKQVLDSRFTVENCAHQLLEGWNLVQRSCSVSGLMRAEPATASGLIWSGALQIATAAGPGAASTDSAAVNWKLLVSICPSMSFFV
ncbi:hypothetical protein QL285_053176 [Trifolium repens]|nr:hypothetical protein QL285_053176 [Trifolium repens]